MTRSFRVYDKMWDKNSVVFVDSYGTHRILGNDGELHVIDPCTANYYMLLKIERDRNEEI